MTLTPEQAALVALLEVHSEPGFPASLDEVRDLAYLLEASEPSDVARPPERALQRNVEARLRPLDGVVLRLASQPERVGAVRLLAGAGDIAQAILSRNPAIRARVARVSRLLDGCEGSPHALRLLAHVHAAAAGTANSPGVHVSEGPGRRPFTPRHLVIATGRLQRDGWLARPDHSVLRP